MTCMTFVDGECKDVDFCDSSYSVFINLVHKIVVYLELGLHTMLLVFTTNTLLTDW